MGDVVKVKVKKRVGGGRVVEGFVKVEVGSGGCDVFEGGDVKMGRVVVECVKGR